VLTELERPALTIAMWATEKLPHRLDGRPSDDLTLVGHSRPSTAAANDTTTARPDASMTTQACVDVPKDQSLSLCGR
jgi:hypothetical protein